MEPSRGWVDVAWLGNDHGRVDGFIGTKVIKCIHEPTDRDLIRWVRLRGIRGSEANASSIQGMLRDIKHTAMPTTTRRQLKVIQRERPLSKSDNFRCRARRRGSGDSFDSRVMRGARGRRPTSAYLRWCAAALVNFHGLRRTGLRNHLLRNARG